MSRVLAGMAVALCAAVCGGSGCGNPKTLVVVNKSDPTRDRLIQFGFAYREACMRTGRPPKNMGELRPVMKDVGVAEEEVISLRDGKPFEVVWGVFFQLVADPDKPPVVLAHEAVGQDGVRYVLWDIGTIELLPDEEFDRARRRGGESATNQ